MNTEEKLRFFYELAICNYDFYFWEYDADMNLITTTCPDPEFLNSILRLSGNSDYLHTHVPEDFSPLMLGDFLGLMWVAVFQAEHAAVQRIHIMGPAFINEKSFSAIENRLNDLHLSVQEKTNLLKCLQKIPLIPSMIYFQYALMFHRCVSDIQLGVSDINLIRREHISNELSKTALSDEKVNQHIGAWDMDQELQKIIRDGNLNYKSTLSKAAVQFPGVKAALGDSIRHAKDTLIVFTAISTRSAISGGLSPEIAHTLGDFYIENIENSRTMPELLNLSHTMFDDFVRRVYKLKQNPDISRAVQTCCDYITMNIQKKITTEELASLTGYTVYYISRKFKNETGYSVNEYIRNAKIEHAKMLLTSTQKSIQEISAELNFCSRSYFSDVFFKVAGMTPREYRNHE